MGYRNLDLYYKYWADSAEFGHVAHRVLVYMAHRSSEDAMPPVYFGGWEDLAIAGGLTKGSAKPDTLRAGTKRALRELKEAGAIVASGQARAGVRENYALALNPDVTFEPEGTGRNVTWKPVNRLASVREKLARPREWSAEPDGEPTKIPFGLHASDAQALRDDQKPQDSGEKEGTLPRTDPSGAHALEDLGEIPHDSADPFGVLTPRTVDNSPWQGIQSVSPQRIQSVSPQGVHGVSPQGIQDAPGSGYTTYPPIEDLSNSIETSIEHTSKANRPSGRTAPRSNPRSKANAEENERNRQTAALRALIEAEQKAKTP